VQKKNISHFTPLLSCLTVGKSKIHGLGIVAISDIKKEVDLGISHILNDKYKDGLIRTPLGGFINHSDSPNSKYKVDGNNLRLITLRQIKKGEEITVSYRGWYSDKILDVFK
jgi:SET domain-containing protein